MAEQQQYQDRTIKVNRVAKVVKGGRRFSFAALDGYRRRGGHRRPWLRQSQRGRAGRPEGHRGGQEEPLQGAPGRFYHHPPRNRGGRCGPGAPETGRSRHRSNRGRRRRPILELAGVHDVVAKSLGSSNSINVAQATMAGLRASCAPTKWPAAAAFRPRRSRPLGCCGLTRTPSAPRGSAV